ncbi:MAG TPA: phosphotransferase family protein [Nocardioidaceae bacterium]|nr:phosphotransferase family protein [Nocardioidaceae bacterium]
MADVPGLDLEKFAAYFDRARPGEVSGPLTARTLAGGKSNLTYAVTDGTRTWVVRRPPLGHVLATAHDMAREHRVVSALAGTDVPVAGTYLLCEDDTVIGAPFYVMDFVAGTPYRSAAQLEPLGPQRTRAISTRLVETLVALHEVSPDSVGLADFGRPEGFLERQVRRWKKQLDGSHSRTLRGADELHAALEQRLPEQQPPAIVHGDYRLDNCLVDDEDRIAAVVDWEMATLGDPYTDLALLVVYQRLATLGGAIVADASTAPGFLSNEEMLALYEQRSGRPLGDLGFYLGLAYFKLAVVLEGIHYRHIHGQTVGSGFDNVGDAVEPLVAAGLSAMKEHS